MPPWWRIKSAKQQASQRKRRETEATNHDSDDEVANTSDSHTNSFHNLDTTESHDSDEHGNDANDDCNNTNSNSMQPSKQNYDTFNNGNSEQNIHQNDIRAINDYISITDKQDSISSLTTETDPLTIFVHDEKIHYRQWGKVGKEKLLVSSTINAAHQPFEAHQKRQSCLQS